MHIGPLCKGRDSWRKVAGLQSSSMAARLKICSMISSMFKEVFAR